MKYLYFFFLIIGITFCSAQSTQTTNQKSTTQKSSPQKPTTSADSSKQSTVKKTGTKTGTTTKQKSAAADSSSDNRSYGKTKVGPGKGYGEMMTQSQAAYPGGDDSLAVFLSHNFKYMNQGQSKGQHGQVNIGFTIDKTGKIQNPIVLKGSANKDVDAEALRVVQMMPNWKPGTSGGQPVDVQYILPIDYFIPE
jgi:TonB family protein